MLFDFLNYLIFVGSLIFLLLGRTSSHLLAILIFLYILGAIYLAYLDFYFLGLTYIIVYVGAIAILFIFLIMLLLNSNSNISTSSIPLPFILLLSVFVYFISFNLKGSGFKLYSTSSLINHPHFTNWFLEYFTFTDISSLANLLFNAYPLLILILGILLFIVLIGLLDSRSN